jgi:hypothetical protein
LSPSGEKSPENENEYHRKKNMRPQNLWRENLFTEKKVPSHLPPEKIYTIVASGFKTTAHYKKEA